MLLNKKITSTLLLAILAFSCLVVLGQQSKKVLTNDDVVKMVKEGLPDNVIVSTIQQHPANYDVSPDALIQLKKQGSSANVLTAVVEAEKQKNSKPTEATASSESKTTRKIDPQIRNDFVFEIIVCQSSGGDSVTCWFSITNKAQERRLSITNASYIMDHLGGQYSATDMWIGNRGKRRYVGGTAASNTLVPEIKMAAALKFQNVRPDITSISALRIVCSWEGKDFPVDFSNIPITPKSPPSPTPKAELQPEKLKTEDLDRYKVRTTTDAEQRDIKDGKPAKTPIGGTTMIINPAAGTVSYQIPFKYRIKHFSLDPRKRLDLCAGIMTLENETLEIRTDSNKSQLGFNCDSKTYRLTKEDIRTLNDTLNSKWYDFKPTTDYLHVKFNAVENNGKDKKKKEFYLYPAEASITYGTRTHTLTGRVLVCPECPAIVCRSCQGKLTAMIDLMDEFSGKIKPTPKNQRVIIFD